MAPATKRRKLDQVEEISFDPSAREEYLTGFHKRKQQRIQNAREAAQKREKEEKIKERRELREQRKEDLEKHVAEVNAELRKQNPDLSESEEWEGVDDGEEDGQEIREIGEDLGQDEEYVDEDKYTTVTVEAMGEPESDTEATVKKTDETIKTDGNAVSKKTKRIWSKDPTKAKVKKKKFRYESKVDRQATRQKQKARNHKAKAARTGKPK